MEHMGTLRFLSLLAKMQNFGLHMQPVLKQNFIVENCNVQSKSKICIEKSRRTLTLQSTFKFRQLDPHVMFYSGIRANLDGECHMRGHRRKSGSMFL